MDLGAGIVLPLPFMVCVYILFYSHQYETNHIFSMLSFLKGNNWHEHYAIGCHFNLMLLYAYNQ